MSEKKLPSEKRCIKCRKLYKAKDARGILRFFRVREDRPIGIKARCLKCERHYDKNRWSTSVARKKRKMPPVIVKAKDAVATAIIAGKIIRQKCSICGEKKAEAHHPDYLKRLEVVWLCRFHHMAEHRRINALKKARAARSTGEK